MAVRVAIVGGGPGGLFAAHMLYDKLKERCNITIYEASSRLGGKIVTKQVGAHQAIYEAGVAELYDYSMIGPDTLRNFIKELGLECRPMQGGTVLLGDRVLRNMADIRRLCGNDTADAIRRFQWEAARQLSREDYYESHWEDENGHPWAEKSCRAILDAIPDREARHYLEIAAHTDLATEPHLTNGLNGLKNFLMDVPGYIRLYTVPGGIERVVDRLVQKIKAEVRLGWRVASIGRTERGYRVAARHGCEFDEQEFDYVVIALPHNWLSMLRWEDPELEKAMRTHIARYDHPAHYLRVSVLFSRPFWRDIVPGTYFMSDVFGGTCLYDEGARYGDRNGCAVLGWLLAGSAAQTMSNLDDETLLREVLNTLPGPLAAGRQFAMEGRVHRWLSSVNALPGGNPTVDVRARHIPEPTRNPGVFLVGDYLFDSTLNGVLDSADFATDYLMSQVLRDAYLFVNSAPKSAERQESRSMIMTRPDRDEQAKITGTDNGQSGNVNKAYHDFYDGENSYEDSFEEYFDAQYTADMIEIIWGAKPPYKLLDCGSANGLTLAEFDKIGIQAWGIENSAHIHARTEPQWRARNILGDVRKMPFADDEFDFLYETSLCYVPPDSVDQAIREMARVCKKGLFFGAITSDMTEQVIEAHDLFYGVSTLSTLWEWSERFLRNGFRLAVVEPEVLARAFACETAANEGDYPWYSSAAAMRYCFYTKINPRSTR